MSRPPTSRRPRRRGLAAATVLLGAITAAGALTGCSAGAVSQTDTTMSGVTAAQGQTGSIVLRDVALDAGTNPTVPAGASISLRGTLVNEGGTTDRLVSVSTPYGSAAAPQGAATIPGNNAIRLVGSDPGPVGPPAPGQAVAGTARVTVNGVTQVLHAGPTYPVTLVFEHSGSVTLPAPVVTGSPVPVS